ncbi:hypothetical protein pb186bvf_015629 [Paramecium bursaria]
MATIKLIIDNIKKIGIDFLFRNSSQLPFDNISQQKENINHFHFY